MSKSVRSDNIQRQGARSLLTDGLSLRSGLPLTILHQDEFSDVAACIKGVADDLSIPVKLHPFRNEEFYDGYPEPFSKVSMLDSRPQPRAIVLLIEWSELTTPARLSLLKDLTSERHHWRIASMPGVDLQGLASCVSDFGLIEKYSRSVFAVLSRSDKAILETPNPLGSSDRLVIPFSDYRSIMSTGRIQDHSWGNFPSGETFIVPEPYKSYGWVTIRGSIPHYPLEGGEWIRIKLSRGKIVYRSVDASSELLAEKFKQLIFDKGKPKAPNTNAFAELGIGTNPGIRELTGVPIFDEKKLDTVHIAFGTNVQFGGPIKSTVHHDIVCTDVSLTAVNRWWKYPVVEAGRFVCSEEIPNLTYDLEIPRRSKLDKSGFAIGTASYTCDKRSRTRDVQLSVNYKSKRDDVTFPVASGEIAVQACAILDKVANGVNSLGELQQAFDLKDASQIETLAMQLLELRLIQLT